MLDSFLFVCNNLTINKQRVINMAKYLKQNEIKAGITIYVTHPKFNGILCKVVTSRPVLVKTEHWTYAGFKYKTVSSYLIENGKAVPMNPFLKVRVEWEERDGYCGDCGIPDKNGVFSYEQERRAFPTLNKALEYWVSQQTPENLKRWGKEREDEFNYFELDNNDL